MRHSSRKARVAAFYPAAELVRITLLRFFLFQARFIRIGQRVDVDTLPLRIFHDEVAFARRNGANRAPSSAIRDLLSAPEQIDPLLCGKRGRSSQPYAVIMISADEYDCPPFAGNTGDRMKKRLFRFSRRHIGIEHVSGNEHKVDRPFIADACDLIKGGDLFGQALTIHKPLADMPVGGVKNVHTEKSDGNFECADKKAIAFAGSL